MAAATRTKAKSKQAEAPKAEAPTKAEVLFDLDAMVAEVERVKQAQLSKINAEIDRLDDDRRKLTADIDRQIEALEAAKAKLIGRPVAQTAGGSRRVAAPAGDRVPRGAKQARAAELAPMLYRHLAAAKGQRFAARDLSEFGDETVKLKPGEVVRAWNDSNPDNQINRQGNKVAMVYYV